MKKIIAIITIIMAMSVVFVGCSKEDNDKDSGSNIENPDSGDKDDDGDKEEEVNVSVDDIAAAIREQIKQDMIEQGMSEEDFTEEGVIPGYIDGDLKSEEENPMITIEINKEDIEEGRLIAPMINLNSNQIIILKASEESKVSDLQAVLESVKESQVGVWEQYLPDQYEKVKNNIIKTNGKYLLYVTYDNPEKIEEIFDDLLK
ncbi:hypothetical protein AN1V17_08520 [Vallitalea sediminicola]